MNSIHEDHQIYSQMYSQKEAAFKKGIFTIQQAEHGESESKSIFDNLNDDEALLLSPIEKSNRV